ncbi:MAG: oligopeptidase A [Planctomycetota bacterium]|jgi:oligopeptidase A
MLKTTTSNPLLDYSGLPLFDQIESDQFVPGIRAAIADVEKRLGELDRTVRPTWGDVYEEPTRIFAALSHAWGVAHHLLAVNNSDELRKAVAEVEPEVVAIYNKASQSKPIYDAAKELAAGAEELNAQQERILAKSIHAMELSGIALEGAELETFNENVARLAALSTEFSNTVLDSTREFRLVLTEEAEVAGLPDTLLGVAAQSAAANGSPEATVEKGPWHITLNRPCSGPFMEYADRRDLREILYKALLTIASKDDLNNGPRVEEILQLRSKQAALLGYDNYAQISISQRMAKDVTEVRALTEQVFSRAKPMALIELEELRAFSEANGGPQADDLQNWDLRYWRQRLRVKQLDFDGEALRPYFPLPKVLEGLFGLSHKLFGVRVEAADGATSVWNEDVRFFNVLDKNSAHIASFYLDPYSRPKDKRGGAWVSNRNGRSVILASPGEDLRLPVPYVVCNFAAPVGDQPALLDFNDVTTLFHEFGHALHNMLTTVDYDTAAGGRGVERDAIELPSQFMENWCYHKPTLLGFSEHFESGNKLPDDLFDKLTQARTFHAATGILVQLTYGEVDMTLHHDYDATKDGSVFDVQQKVSERILPLKPWPGNRFLCAFQHIFAGGYVAGYYGYIWAEVLSADAFGAFEEAGLDNEDTIRELGIKFRSTVLAPGGAKDPAEIFKAFRGRPFEVDALLRHRGIA